MKNKVILIAVLALILVTTISFLYSYINTNITGEVISEKNYYYTYTKAICDENKYCQDYEIVCNGEEVIETNPITGAVVQQRADWEDPRDEEIINGFCNVTNRSK